MRQLWIEIGLLAMFMSYLLFKHYQRVKHRFHVPYGPCHGFDAAPLQSRIHHVRENYLTAPRVRRPKPLCREEIVASIRQTIRHRDYFSHRPPDESTDAAIHETLMDRR